MKDITILKENGIDVEQGIELLGDIEMYEETLADFIQESEERLPKMEEYKQAEDMQNYAILAHAMKSDSKYLGFTTLAELSLQHELQAKENKIEFIKENYQTLMQEVSRVLQIIENYLNS